MALSTQQSDDDSHYVLVAKLDNARNLSSILKAINFKDVSGYSPSVFFTESLLQFRVIQLEVVNFA